MPTEDLWGKEVVNSQIRTPLLIMREQAALLATKTSAVLHAEVRTVRTSNNGARHEFFFVIPSLENYRYKLFIATHSELVYPVEIHFDPLESPLIADTEAEFVAALRTVLSHSRTISVFQSLLAQARSGDTT